MFSFKQTKERIVSPHTYVVKEESDEEVPVSMDINPQEDIPFTQFVFPPSEYLYVMQSPQQFFFKHELLPLTLLPLSPAVLNGLESIDELTGMQKATASVYTALPIPVHHSPLVALFLDNIPKESKTRPQKKRYINWVQSVFQLRCFIPLIIQHALPFHSSVKNEYPQECFDEFLEQMHSYEEFHRERVEALFVSPEATNVFIFTQYCVEFCYYYIHSLERFIFKTLVEPHVSANELFKLEHILTPVDMNISAMQCENKESMLKCIVDFFELKVLATQKHGQRYAGEDYVFRNPIQVGLIEQRIKSADQKQLYMGCLDIETMKEYLTFCNPQINVK